MEASRIKTPQTRLLGRLPLRELAQALLPGPDGRVHDLEEQLTSAGVEHKYSTINRFRGEVAFKRLVDGHAVDLRGFMSRNCRESMKLPREHETAASCSHGRVDGVTVASRRVDALGATSS